MIVCCDGVYGQDAIVDRVLMIILNNKTTNSVQVLMVCGTV